MDSEMKIAITITDKQAQYDLCAKTLLANKWVLAKILIQTVDEFQNMDVEEVIALIEGEPIVSLVSVEAGVTNAVIEKNGIKIAGLNTESAENNEGTIRFDIIFYVLATNGHSKIIINIEAQKSNPKGYHLMNRGIFYASRMISSQKEREFVHSDYDDIKQVYSIWICTNESENSMNHIHLVDDAIVGNKKMEGSLDVLNIIFIGLSRELPEHNETYSLHRLLGTLLSDKLGKEQKLNILASEYSLSLEDSVEEVVETMCNLSYGIREEGIKEGIKEGANEYEFKMVSFMYKKGHDADEIHQLTGADKDKIIKIIKEIS